MNCDPPACCPVSHGPGGADAVNQSIQGPHEATQGQAEATSQHHHGGQQPLRHEVTQAWAAVNETNELRMLDTGGVSAAPHTGGVLAPDTCGLFAPDTDGVFAPHTGGVPTALDTRGVLAPGADAVPPHSLRGPESRGTSGADSIQSINPSKSSKSHTRAHEKSHPSTSTDGLPACCPVSYGPGGAGLCVHPQKGCAVLFYSTDASLCGDVDPRSWHGGGAVTGPCGKWTVQVFCSLPECVRGDRARVGEFLAKRVVT